MEIRLPNFDVNDREAIISEIYVEDGETVEKGQILLKVENAKAVSEIHAEESGICKMYCRRLEKKQVGDLLLKICSNQLEYEKETALSQEEKKEEPKCNATRKAMELAKLLGVELLKVAEQKNGGLVKTKDVQDYADGLKAKEQKTRVPSRINPYDRERVLIIGAGKGAEIVIDILLDDKDKYVAGLADTYVTEFPSYPFPLFTMDIREVPSRMERAFYDTVILSVGSTLETMKVRKELYEAYTACGLSFTNAIADSADIRRGVRIGTGNVIMHNSYIGTGTVIGNNNMISYGLNLGHHCVVGNHNLIAPSFTTAGNVAVGDECILTTGVMTRSFVTIGSRVVLPLGYTVQADIPDDTIIRQTL